MREKKDRSERARRDPIRLSPRFAHILVTSHTEEPYLIAFRHTADNVASKNLGTLVGFFEIEMHDSDAAYIVNFLASVAKKEYFANARRGPVESFEAALHKINIALSELVKHGNITWLGRLHGALAIVVDQTIHFSVAGDGAIWLFRQGKFRSISEGLSLQEENPHPLKTFVEIASGDLIEGDRVLLLSPAVWTLFTPLDIEKSIGRFSPAALEQFLRTALVNEVGSGAALLVTCDKEISPPPLAPPPTAEADESPAPLGNVFAETAFHPKKEKSPPLTPAASESTPKKEFTDKKTGHIYVHGEGDTREEHSLAKEKLRLYWQHASLWGQGFSQKTSRLGRRFRKNTLLFGLFLRDRSGYVLRSLGRKSRSWWRRGIQTLQTVRAKWQARAASKTPSPLITAHQREVFAASPSPILDEEKVVPSQTGGSPPLPQSETMPPSDLSPLGAWIRRAEERTTTPKSSLSLWSFSITLREQFQAWSTALRPRFFSLTKAVDPSARKFFTTLKTLLSQKQRLAVLIVLLILGAFLVRTFSSDTQDVASLPPPSTENIAPTSTFPLEREKNATRLDGGEEVFVSPDNTLLSLVSLDSVPYAITATNVINLATRESTPTPSKVTKATAMDDLNTIFLLAEDNSLSAFTPGNGRFTNNTLPLPAGTNISELGAYLTYLYVLDAPLSRLYRFPRVEGGFGPPVSWFRQPVTLTPEATLALREFIVIGDQASVTKYERGQLRQTFESPAEEMNVTQLALSQDGTVFALDRRNKRVIRWSADGQIEVQYFSDTFAEADSVHVSPDKKTLFVGRENNVLRFTLP